MREKKYMIVSRKFENYSAASCPLSGQIATDSKIFAYLIYYYLKLYSYKYYGSIAVMLVKRNKEGTYDTIKR